MKSIDRKEAIDNLRVAVKATLLVCPQHEYRIWAQKYLEQTEPRMEGLDEINDMAVDSIAELAGWRPWTNLGRARECWLIIRDICDAHQQFGQERWQNATSCALAAAKRCLGVGERSQAQMLGFMRNLERSLYGEVVS